MSESFYLCLSTLKTFTAAEVAGQRASRLRKPVLKPRKSALAPTSLDEHWAKTATSACEEAGHLACLGGDDDRDDVAARHLDIDGEPVDSDCLGQEAQALLCAIAHGINCRSANDLKQRVADVLADLRLESRNYAAVCEWVVTSLRDTIDYPWDSIDSDERRVLRYLAKQISSTN
jgi:hypothetical protein